MFGKFGASVGATVAATVPAQQMSLPSVDLAQTKPCGQPEGVELGRHACPLPRVSRKGVAPLAHRSCGTVAGDDS